MTIYNLEIQMIATHQVFKLHESTERVRLNDNITSLEPAGLGVIKSRVIEAIGEDTKSLELRIINTDENSAFQTLARMIYSDEIEYVDLSKKLTNMLASKQTSTRIPGGILVFFKGTISDVNNREKKYIGIIKAECQDGFALNSNDKGIDLTYIADLLLTRTQKLYKVVLFIENESISRDQLEILRDPSEFQVIIYDSNMNHRDTQNAAQYFYKEFLGCDLLSTNRKLTRDFYCYTKEFINNAPILSEMKIDLYSALCNYLKISRETIISRSDFADRFFNSDLADSYIRYMNEKNFPSNAIAKDLSLIEKYLKRRRMHFNTNVRIYAPFDSFNELITIEECDDPQYTKIKIKGEITDQ